MIPSAGCGAARFVGDRVLSNLKLRNFETAAAAKIIHLDFYFRASRKVCDKCFHVSNWTCIDSEIIYVPTLKLFILIYLWRKHMFVKEYAGQLQLVIVFVFFDVKFQFLQKSLSYQLRNRFRTYYDDVSKLFLLPFHMCNIKLFWCLYQI